MQNGIETSGKPEFVGLIEGLVMGRGAGREKEYQDITINFIDRTTGEPPKGALIHMDFVSPSVGRTNYIGMPVATAEKIVAALLKNIAYIHEMYKPVGVRLSHPAKPAIEVPQGLGSLRLVGERIVITDVNGRELHNLSAADGWSIEWVTSAQA